MKNTEADLIRLMEEELDKLVQHPADAPRFVDHNYLAKTLGRTQAEVWGQIIHIFMAELGVHRSQRAGYSCKEIAAQMQLRDNIQNVERRLAAGTRGALGLRDKEGTNGQ